MMLAIMLLLTTQTLWLIHGFMTLLFFDMQLMQVVKRLHDLERSGWLAALLMIPFVNFYIIYLLLFRRGTEGQNVYGAEFKCVPGERT